MMHYHITPSTNIETIFLQGLQPKVGDRSKKLNELPGVFMFATEKDMEDGIINWLDNEFVEDEPLVSLKISLPDNFPLESPVPYEVVSRCVIDAKYISIYKEI